MAALGQAINDKGALTLSDIVALRVAWQARILEASCMLAPSSPTCSPTPASRG